MVKMVRPSQWMDGWDGCCRRSWLLIKGGGGGPARVVFDVCDVFKQQGSVGFGCVFTCYHTPTQPHPTHHLGPKHPTPHNLTPLHPPHTTHHVSPPSVGPKDPAPHNPTHPPTHHVSPPPLAQHVRPRGLGDPRVVALVPPPRPRPPRGGGRGGRRGRGLDIGEVVARVEGGALGKGVVWCVGRGGEWCFMPPGGEVGRCVV